MKIINLEPGFKKGIKEILDKCGYGSVAYDELGFLFSNYFMNAFEKIHKEDPDKILEIDSIGHSLLPELRKINKYKDTKIEDDTSSKEGV